MLLGYDEHGRCPMLTEGAARSTSTGPARAAPMTAGSSRPPASSPKAASRRIARRARRWRFEHPAEADRDQHEAVRAAVTFIRRHAADLPEGAVPATATGLAVLAIELHGTFLDRDADSGRTAVVVPAPSVVRVELSRRARTGA